MTRTLILTRHAKSSWGDHTLSDHARPLNNRGRKSAVALGEWLRDKGWIPDQVLCSSAVRTRETWAGMAFDDPRPHFTDALYHAGPTEILETLKAATGTSVLLLGHNPGIAEFAGNIVEEAPSHARFFDYPTGATTVIEFAIDAWGDVRWHSGEVLDFVVPRELIE
ncbi:SixA phosphatase family protein [Ruegeria marina]|uniref:Phosphohistidine phosphatase n=1 Tax=Ruegeria marina TaxID=639004 RepID=A0A1G6PFH9_9RHOB|nr:histidine phosphatase family protein [Ruegeria marina]SDC78314.1 phosphohistidine phosphatase [Ruegeria marina]